MDRRAEGMRTQGGERAASRKAGATWLVAGGSGGGRASPRIQHAVQQFIRQPAHVGGERVTAAGVPNGQVRRRAVQGVDRCGRNGDRVGPLVLEVRVVERGGDEAGTRGQGGDQVVEIEGDVRQCIVLEPGMPSAAADDVADLDGLPGALVGDSGRLGDGDVLDHLRLGGLGLAAVHHGPDLLEVLRGAEGEDAGDHQEAGSTRRVPGWLRRGGSGGDGAAGVVHVADSRVLRSWSRT